MNRLAVLALLVPASIGFGQEIHLKARTFSTVPGTSASGGSPGHRIVEFDHHPSVDDLAALANDGLQVIGALPDNAVVVADSEGNAGVQRPGIRWVGGLDVSDKLSPALGSDNPVTAIVEFHGDVSTDAQNAVAASEGLTLLRPAVLVANHAIVSGSLDNMKSLAAHDEVAYMFPADPGLLSGDSLLPCAGMLTQSGPVPQYANIVHGWDLDSDSAAHLGYVFGSLTTRAPALAVQGEIIRALNEWSKHVNVIFEQGTNGLAPRTILIKFVSGSHGDAYPFQGFGPVLAHTFYPVPVNSESIAGDMHLNADELWHVGSDYDIYSVVLHEAGHAIGLGHSDKPGDVMYPYYRANMALSANDIGAAKSLYGDAGSSIAAPVTVSNAVNPAAPLRMTLDPVVSSTQGLQVAVTGVVSGGTPPFAVQWQTDHGYAGQAAIDASGAWTAQGIALVNGSNNLTFTAFDSAHQTVTRTVPVTKAAPASSASAGSAPVSISLTTPAAPVTTVSVPSISLAGNAAGGAGISRVTWQTSAGISGTATGTGHWVASNVPVMTGTTTIIVRAFDANGLNAWASVVAVRY